MSFFRWPFDIMDNAMQLIIHAHGLDLTTRLKRQTYEKIDLALDRIADEVEVVRVFLADTNGPELGGVDKACRIVVTIRQHAPIEVSDMDENVHEVVDRATDRLGIIACECANRRGAVTHRKTSKIVYCHSEPGYL